jgi:NAD(P)-dependent dehydrogenase (short-subunit alcohol dehydrogenase family)
LIVFLIAPSYAHVDSAQDVKKAIEEDPQCKGRKVLLVPADLMDEANCKDVVEKHIKEYGHLEILVNNVSSNPDRIEDVHGPLIWILPYMQASKQIMCKDLADIDVGSRGPLCSVRVRSF